MGLSHTDEQGRACMVNVEAKEAQYRRAVACGTIHLSAEVLSLIHDNQIKKGDVLAVAQIAGIQAAKQTTQLIPLCHNITLNQVEVTWTLQEDRIIATSMVRCVGRTGVEMEALTAVSVALLTVYDMCKAVDKQMRISDIRLLEKEKRHV